MGEEHIESEAALRFRLAEPSDLPKLVELLANDPLGSKRERFETPLPQAYTEAFKAIERDPNHLILIADIDDQIAGFLQLSFLPNLTYIGGWRAQIEGVRVALPHRGQGIGGRLIDEACIRADAKGCRLIQLTTDKQRPEAIRFYEQKGFTGSHIGMKKPLGKTKPR